MSAVLFFSDLRRRRISFLVWVLVLPLMSLFRMAEYPDFHEKYSNAQEALGEFSTAEISLFGLGGVDLTTIVGYYGARVFSVVLLLGAVYVMMLASTILSKEEDDKTIEFLMVQPVTRNAIVVSKLAVVMVYTFALNCFLFLGSWGMCLLLEQNGYDLKALALLALGSLMIHLMFAATGFLLSVFVIRSGTIYPVAIGIVLAAYLLQLMANSNSSFEWLKYVSFFAYSNVFDATRGIMIRLRYLIVSLVVIVGCCTSALLVYRRKDIAA